MYKTNIIPLSYMIMIFMNRDLNALERDVKARLMIAPSPRQRMGEKWKEFRV